MGRKWSQEEKDRMRDIMRSKYAGVTTPSSFGDSLRGYGHKTYQRDDFKCRYCGADGTKSFETWLTLSCDHLLPKGHPNRDNPDYIVTACNFCNVADNHYFEKAEKLGLKFDGLTPDELVDQRMPFVLAVRQKYRDFWEKEVNTLVEEPLGSDWVKTFYDLFAPVRQYVLESGMTEDEVNQIIDEAIREVREERKAKQQPG